MIGAQFTSSENQGPEHGGHGDQFNYFVADFMRGRRRSRTTAKDHLDRLNQQLVEPPGYGKARDLLTEHGCAILVGTPGIGRRATGQVLLRRWGGPDAVVQDETGIPEQPGDPILDTSDLGEGDLVLLDPSGASDEELFRVMQRLPSYRAELHERRARLVVVLAEDSDELVRMDLRPLLAHIGRPNGLDVVRRHLEVADIPFTEDQLRSNAALQPRLAHDPIPTLAELVRLIGAARERLGNAAGFGQWLAAALDALNESDKKVAAQVRDQRDGVQRALLLASAMLVQAPADQVYVAARKLAVATGQPDDERPPLERDDLTERLTGLNIAVVDGRMRFPTVGYDRTVRQYFWTNFPELRRRFRDWARQIGVASEIAQDHRAEFVAHFAEQALRTDRPHDLVNLVEAWLEPTGDRSRSLAPAAIALEYGLTDQRHGARFRRLIYHWSRQPGLDRHTARLAITLGAEVIASTHPAEALVRLHHFARRQADDVRAAAVDALLRLVHQDRREFRRLLDRVTTDRVEPRWEVDLDLFLVLAGPRELGGGLLDDHVVREQLVRGWQAVLYQQPSAFWASTAWAWLDAIENGRFADHLLNILAQACARPGVGSGRLYVMARDWTREPGADRQLRSRIALTLTERMDRAQDFGPRHHSEEPIR